MNYSETEAFSLPSPWLQLNVAALELLFASALLLGSASLFAMASGDPEAMALVALAGIAVVLLGTTLVRASERLRTTDLSLSE